MARKVVDLRVVIGYEFIDREVQAKEWSAETRQRGGGVYRTLHALLYSRSQCGKCIFVCRLPFQPCLSLRMALDAGDEHDTNTHTTIIIVVSVVGSIVGLAVLAAIFFPCIARRYHRKLLQDADQRAIPNGSNKGAGSQGWVPGHEYRASDSHVPFLDAEMQPPLPSADVTAYKHHYRRVSGNVPVAPLGYVSLTNMAAADEEFNPYASDLERNHFGDPARPYHIVFPPTSPPVSVRTYTAAHSRDYSDASTIEYKPLTPKPVAKQDTVLQNFNPVYQHGPATKSTLSTIGSTSIYSQGSAVSLDQMVARPTSTSPPPPVPPLPPLIPYNAGTKDTDISGPGVERSDTVKVASLLHQRARMHDQRMAGPKGKAISRSSTGVSHIERAGSIKPYVSPHTGASEPS
ncbi:hypothetical protein AMATHDRAFT_71903 [Amanita thiersii Skay4041]|uniref:Uncharacterized protein n=1 Tax=Amanita thiersii Skay4041 TaxID=703135 RepID=A0A2A9NBX3_9AGAR|nr:hypothetical protein AMATHDRAFT_71903 [Amanita thiersii Skay4041]